MQPQRFRYQNNLAEAFYPVSKRSNDFEVIEGYHRTAAFLAPLQEAADAHRQELGFFAKSVYEEFARNDLLFILTHKASDMPVYAGHLMFACRHPRANILQVFVLPEFRRHGRAADMIQHLKNALTQHEFISIYARVAEDLVAANAFWDSQQFYVQRVDKGGNSKNRKIVVRCHELPTPQLFPPSGIRSEDPLGLSIPTPSDVPLFLLDLNVLFDVMPRRLRNADATALFQAERFSACRLAISTEIREELRRTAHDGKTDPMEAYISIFPAFPLAGETDSKYLLRELATLVFPEKVLSNNDKSDLRHLATAICHDLAGFITSDATILAASSQIQAKYGLQVISPAAFKMDGSPTGPDESFDVSPNNTLRLSSTTAEDGPSVRALLAKIGLSGSSIASYWYPAETQAGTRMTISKNTALIGFLTWTNPLPGSEAVVARIAIDENDLGASAAGRVLLSYLLDTLALSGPQFVRLELPAHQNLLRELAFGLGFRGADSQAQLTKLVLGRVFTRLNWASYAKEISLKGGPKLPSAMPEYRNVDQHIIVLTPDGNQTHVSLDLLETLLSPALFCFPGRPAVITPIQRKFSEALLGHSKQALLLPHGSASTYQDRHYLSSPRTLRYFKRGTLMFFYESTKQRGRGELVALARVRQSYLKPSTDLISNLQRSVISKSSLTVIGKAEAKTVTVFDNIFHLPRPVPLSSLQRIGCGKPTDLITTRPITEIQFQEILQEAFQNG